jgi:hypothetical protein
MKTITPPEEDWADGSKKNNIMDEDYEEYG